jgi:hypothetical protein
MTKQIGDVWKTKSDIDSKYYLLVSVSRDEKINKNLVGFVDLQTGILVTDKLWVKDPINLSVKDVIFLEGLIKNIEYFGNLKKYAYEF